MYVLGIRRYEVGALLPEVLDNDLFHKNRQYLQEEITVPTIIVMSYNIMRNLQIRAMKIPFSLDDVSKYGTLLSKVSEESYCP